MRYNYKYAMPMDPKVLELDFKSVQGAEQDIRTMVSALSLVEDIQDYVFHDSFIRRKLNTLWFSINFGKGINLREREKLIPLFKELSRIFKKHEQKYSVAYRGVTLPSVYQNLLTKTFGQDNSLKTTKIALSQYPEEKTILENLAYGMRSWAVDGETAEGWALNSDYPKSDAVIFVNTKPHLIFDCDSYFKGIPDTPVGNPPFDRGELICFEKNPTALSISLFRKKNKSSTIYKVELK